MRVTNETGKNNNQKLFNRNQIRKIIIIHLINLVMIYFSLVVFDIRQYIVSNECIKHASAVYLCTPTHDDGCS